MAGARDPLVLSEQDTSCLRLLPVEVGRLTLSDRADRFVSVPYSSPYDARSFYGTVFCVVRRFLDGEVLVIPSLRRANSNIPNAPTGTRIRSTIFAGLRAVHYTTGAIVEVVRIELTNLPVPNRARWPLRYTSSSSIYSNSSSMSSGTLRSSLIFGPYHLR